MSETDRQSPFGLRPECAKAPRALRVHARKARREIEALTPPYISDIERGLPQSRNQEQYARLAKALGLTTSELLRGSGRVSRLTFIRFVLRLRRFQPRLGAGWTDGESILRLIPTRKPLRSSKKICFKSPKYVKQRLDLQFPPTELANLLGDKGN